MDPKQQIINKLQENKVRLEVILRKINKIDTLRVLLAIMDTLENQTDKIRHDLVLGNNKNDGLLLAYSNSFEHFMILYKLINYVIKNTKNNKSTFSTGPLIDCVLLSSTSWEFPNAKRFLSEHYDLSRVILYYHTMGMSETPIKFRRYYVLKNPGRFNNLSQIERTIGLLKTYWSYLGNESSLRKISKYMKDPDSIPSDFLDAGDILDSQGLPIRTIEMGEQRFPFWKTAVIESKNQTLKSINANRQESDNVDRLMHEIDLEFAQFEKTPEFEKQFSKVSGFEFDTYKRISKSILLTRLNAKGSTVFFDTKENLINSVELSTKISRDQIESFVDRFLNVNSESIFEKPIIYDGKNCLFSWAIIGYPIKQPLHECYEDLIDNDLKGKQFEDECRKMLLTQFQYVAKDRIQISKPVLPREISISLWKDQKRSTDIDVVGGNNDILYIIECKSRKTPTAREQRLVNLCKKYYQELYFKTKWISENYSEFFEIAKNQGIELPSSCKYIVPVFVTNLIGFKEVRFFTCGINELQHIFRQMKPPALNRVSLGGTEMEIPFFKVIADKTGEQNPSREPN